MKKNFLYRKTFTDGFIKAYNEKLEEARNSDLGLDQYLNRVDNESIDEIISPTDAWDSHIVRGYMWEFKNADNNYLAGLNLSQTLVQEFLVHRLRQKLA